MSDETKHTPGPWRVDRHGAVVAPVDGGMRQVALATGEAPMHDDRSAEPPSPEVIQQANARLIAAAPELAEACALSLAAINSPSEEAADKAERACRAALEKAGLR